MAEREPDRVTHETHVLPGVIVYTTRMVWDIPPREGVEADWIDELLTEVKS